MAGDLYKIDVVYFKIYIFVSGKREGKTVETKRGENRAAEAVSRGENPESARESESGSKEKGNVLAQENS